MFNVFYKEIFDGVSFKNDYLQEEIDQKKTFSNFTQLYKLPKYLEKVFLKLLLFNFLVYYSFNFYIY
jgi:hypothetical protein